MADQEQLDILKQDVEEWNEWRKEHPDVQINLSNAPIGSADLFEANLTNADLSGAGLNSADLRHADLRGADLSGAELVGAKISDAILSNTNLTDADLSVVDLSGSDLSGSNFNRATISYTTFGAVDLSTVKGLETVQHLGPSTIGIDTIIESQGNIPEIFLRGVGVPPSIIEAIPSLIGSLEPIQFYSCFISYSSKDQDFAERLHADLLAKGVRCWYAPYDLKIGDKWRDRIEESIRLHDKLMLVLSHHSIESPRVEEEVVSAQEKEERYFRETGVERLVLFPICLDEAVMNTSKAWAANLHRLRHIGDFTGWTNHHDYEKAFNRLLRDLKSEAMTG